MSPRSTEQAHGSGGRAMLTALLVVLVAVALMLIIRARPTTEPFDPRSGAGNGTRGLVLLLEQYGADVQIGRSVPAPSGGRRVLVLQDRLDSGQRDGLAEFAEAGGVVVMADPSSELTAPRLRPSALGEATVPRGACGIASLAHLRSVRTDDAQWLHAPDGAAVCFGDSGESLVVALPTGNGLIVALGDNRPFTNERLRFEDNAGLATALLAPSRDAAVYVLLGNGAAKSVADIGTGERTLWSLVRPSVWMALVQLAIAFVIVALARGVRAGRPVREPAQAPIAGSELVVATGSLMQRARHHQRAGWLLRADVYRDLCRQLHLPSTIAIGDLDREVAARTGLEPGRLAAALGREVADDAQLLALTAELHAIRERTTLQGATR